LTFSIGGLFLLGITIALLVRAMHDRREEPPHEDHRRRRPLSASARDPGPHRLFAGTPIVRVSTDAGITGWGGVDGCPFVTKAVIETPMSHTLVTGLRQLLIGEDPLEGVPNAFVMEYCIEPSKISRALAKNPIPVVDGHAAVPEEPGLGVESNPAIIEKYLVR
jgi:L-alanine-DL-glutamate epimerase-like enolase superfamily enzyme